MKLISDSDYRRDSAALAERERVVLSVQDTAQRAADAAAYRGEPTEGLEAELAEYSRELQRLAGAKRELARQHSASTDAAKADALRLHVEGARAFADDRARHASAIDAAQDALRKAQEDFEFATAGLWGCVLGAAPLAHQDLANVMLLDPRRSVHTNTGRAERDTVADCRRILATISRWTTNPTGQPEPEPTVKVVALRDGYFADRLRYEGQTFDVPASLVEEHTRQPQHTALGVADAVKMSPWFVPVDQAPAPKLLIDPKNYRHPAAGPKPGSRAAQGEHSAQAAAVARVIVEKRNAEAVLRAQGPQADPAWVSVDS
jgi:hypothetical protein